MAGLFSRVKETLRHGWNVFTDSNYLDGLHSTSGGNGFGYYMPPSRNRASYSSERSLISAIYTRLGIDVSGIDIRHVRTDEDGRYKNDISSGLQDCLTVDPNLDQGPRQFRQDIAMTLFQRGIVAIVPVETDLNPNATGGYDIQQLRAGEIVGWQPEHVRVSLYDQRSGERKIVTVPKSMTAIVENPLYEVMNEPNSTLKRLIHKINMLDTVDDASSSGKLDLIIQLPYVVKSDARRQQAEQRRKDIEVQLKGSKYGIAYTDGTEKIQQLNRPVDNNLLEQIRYLTDKLYTELGLTPEVMNGTADEKVMLNYFNRTINPVVQAIAEEMKRKFLTKTARSQKQSIMYFRNPFALVPMEQIAEIADKFTRNEILSANEIRQGIGFKPSGDPKADQLVNSNMPQPGTDVGLGAAPPEVSNSSDSNDSGSDPGSDAVSHALDEANGMVDQILAELGASSG
jgi:phage portal protein BeeE